MSAMRGKRTQKFGWQAVVISRHERARLQSADRLNYVGDEGRTAPTSKLEPFVLTMCRNIVVGVIVAPSSVEKRAQSTWS